MDEVRAYRVAPAYGPRRRTKVVFVSTYPPRHCGIATFTRDLGHALAEVAPDLAPTVCAVDRDGLDYGPDVASVLRQDEYDDYRQAAAEIADAGAGVVVIEHEYGIFGGPDGAWITRFADELYDRDVPFMVTLHTVLSQPSAGQAATLRRLCRRACAVSVFTETAKRLAVATGIAPADRVVVVPHGAPTVLRQGFGAIPAESTDAFWEARPEVVELLAESSGKRLVSTFGLISPGKGLETAVKAVAAVADEHPQVRYVIAGSTHPEVAKEHGEGYRQGLVDLVAELGVEEQVRFLDFFLTDGEIALLLGRTEVFLTPYRSREQISSGVLTFAVAAGCPVVSTSYFYAQDLLASGAGVLVENGDDDDFAQALRGLLADAEQLAAVRLAATEIGRTLGWPSVASRFAEILRGAIRRYEVLVVRQRALQLDAASV